MKIAARIWAVAFVALALGVGVLLLRPWAQGSGEEVSPSTAAVVRGDLDEIVSTRGNVVAERQTTLAFKTSGPISEISAEAGQPVEAGQVLARLDTSSLQWQVARAEASLATALARLEQAQQPPSAEELASAQAAVDSAKQNYEQVSLGPSAEDVASARSSLESARANLLRVKAGATAEELAAAQASVESAQAAVRQAQAAYDRVSWRPDVAMLQESLNLQNAAIELERARANHEALKSRPTASDLATAEAQVAQAEAQLAQLRDRPSASELASAEAQISQAEAQLAQLRKRPQPSDLAVYEAQVAEARVALAQAKDQLDDALLVAPYAGTVLEVRIQEGEWATPGSPALVLAATDPLILSANVDEIDVPRLAEGQPARLSFNAINGYEILGVVQRIAPASTIVNGAVAYGVDIGFSPGETPVRLGMTSDVDVVVASAKGALLVPNRAITADREAGRYYVTRQRGDGTSEQVEIKIGLRGDSQTQVLEGLAVGDLVVLPQLPAQQSDQQSGGFGGRGPFGRPGGGQ